MLARYKNEKQIERYKGFVIIDGITYANNEEKAREAGFKDLVIEEQPEYDPETEWLDYTYEDGEVITQKWVVMPIEESE
jgi:hypothetical protein